MGSDDKIIKALEFLDVPYDKAKTEEEVTKALGYSTQQEAHRFFYNELYNEIRERKEQNLVQIVKTVREGKEDIHYYTISPYGRAILAQNKRDKFQGELVNNSKNQNLLMFLLIVATVIIAISTHDLQKSQAEIFNESVIKQIELSDAQIAALAPVIPQINMSIDPENLIFEDEELSRHYLDDKGDIRGDNRGTRFEFIVRNIGQTDTGSIRINELDEELHLYPGSIYIPNIKGLSAELNYSGIYLENCGGGSPPGSEGKPCTPEAVTNGTRNISFEIFCTFCEPKVKIQTFKMCVWRQSATECENKTG